MIRPVLRTAALMLLGWGGLLAVAAVAQTLRDPEFLADAEKLKIDIAPMDAAATTKMVDQLYATPQPIVAKLQAALSVK